MIEFRSLSKSFDSVTALDQFSLTVQSREVHILVGSSGSGKSTLLKVLMGLIPATKGEILLDGEPLQTGYLRKFYDKIGYVPQDGGLFPHMTAEANVTLVGRLRGAEAKKIESRLDELCRLVGLDRDLLRHYPRQLSGGQKQRVAIMRAAFLDPLILVFDEPLGALDPIIRADLQTELRRIFKQMNKTVLLVTHDIGEAAFFGDRVTLLHEGRIVQTGTMKELIENPRDLFVKQFIHSQRTLSDWGPN